MLSRSRSHRQHNTLQLTCFYQHARKNTNSSYPSLLAKCRCLAAKTRRSSYPSPPANGRLYPHQEATNRIAAHSIQLLAPSSRSSSRRPYHSCSRAAASHWRPSLHHDVRQNCFAKYSTHCFASGPVLYLDTFLHTVLLGMSQRITSLPAFLSNGAAIETSLSFWPASAEMPLLSLPSAKSPPSLCLIPHTCLLVSSTRGRPRSPSCSEHL